MMIIKPTRLIIIMCLLFEVSSGSKVLADTLELTSGNTLEGKVISLDLKSVVLDQNNSRISIGKDQVSKIIFSHKQVQKQLKDNQISQNTEVESLKELPPVLKNKIEIEKNIQKEIKTDITPLKTETKPKEEGLNKMVLTHKTTADKVKAGNNKPTYIKGSSSNRLYYGLYNQSSDNKNLMVDLSFTKSEKLSYKLFAQKNGTIPALYTSSLIVFKDNNGNIIEKTQPAVIDNDKLIEWFKNLENIAGVSGEKEICVTIPKNAYIAEIIGYRSGSTSSIIGYISDIKIDNKDIEVTFSQN